MNVENIKLLRDTIAASGRLNMRRFQSNGTGTIFTAEETLEKFHTCGNRACIAGFMALLPKFQAEGGIVAIDGCPVMDGRHLSSVVADWLDLDRRFTCVIVFGHVSLDDYDFSKVGVKNAWEDWTADDAVRILDAVLSGEFS